MFIEQMPNIIRWFYPTILWRKNKNEKILYLTFDDSPNPELTYWILDELDKFKIKATFFCIGNKAKKYPEIIEEITRRGHSLGLHGFTHKRGVYKNTKNFYSEIKECAKHVDSRLFRPPHGDITIKQAKQLSKEYKVVLWDVITRDYNQSLSPEKIYNIAIKYARNGSIIVFHDSIKAKENMQYAFVKAVKHWLEQGYKFEVITTK